MRQRDFGSVISAVKIKRLSLISVVVLALALLGSACSATNPSALTVGNWTLSNSDFTEQLNGFAKVYEASNGKSQLRSSNGEAWLTSFTAAFLNDQLSLRLARQAVEDRGLTVTDDDRASATTQLEQNFTSASGSVFRELPSGLQKSLIEGVAAQTVLLTNLLTEAQTDEGLRRVYESTRSQYDNADYVCASHILALAGSGSPNQTPTEAQFADALTRVTNWRNQIVGGSNFGAVARANSQDTQSAVNDGVLECAPRGTFVTEFDNAAWTQPIGVLGEPVRTTYGYHVILVTARGRLTFEQLKPTLKTLIQQNAETILNAELIATAERTSISVDGRYGDYVDARTRIKAPAGATPLTTTPSTINPLP